MDEITKNLIQSIPIWKGNIEIKTIDGGLTNKNYLIQESSKKFVVRLGDDIPEHLISRSNELIASKAASEANIGPKMIYSGKGILVLEYIESTTLTAKDVRDKIDLIIPLLKKIHYEIPKKIFVAVSSIKIFKKVSQNLKKCPSCKKKRQNFQSVSSIKTFKKLSPKNKTEKKIKMLKIRVQYHGRGGDTKAPSVQLYTGRQQVCEGGVPRGDLQVGAARQTYGPSHVDIPWAIGQSFSDLNP